MNNKLFIFLTCVVLFLTSCSQPAQTFDKRNYLISTKDKTIEVSAYRCDVYTDKSFIEAKLMGKCINPGGDSGLGDVVWEGEITSIQLVEK